MLDAVSVLKRVLGMPEDSDNPNNVRQKSILSTRELAERAVNPEATKTGDDEYVPPYPYYAVLIADGDRMGQLLSNHESVEDHQKISKQLDEFAAEAEQIVKSHDGQPIFVGGDDVMALLPVTRAIGCAAELAEAFKDALKDFKKGDEGATLSVGIAIVHYLEPLSVSLNHARAAEKHAKVTRNALSVALHTRGGAPMTVRQGWDDTGIYGKLPLAHWLGVARAGGISRGMPYELRELAREWPLDPTDGKHERVLAPAALKGEVERIWSKKRDRETGQTRQAVTLPDFEKREDLTNFAQILTLARFLSGQALATAAASQEQNHE